MSPIKCYRLGNYTEPLVSIATTVFLEPLGEETMMTVQKLKHIGIQNAADMHSLANIFEFTCAIGQDGQQRE